jgi:catechol 2,3-dioxygenase-like lactoylglutathione lyase family enzyme
MLRGATLTTTDLEAAVARYRDFLEYAVVESGRVPESLAASWGTPSAAGRRYALMRPASGESVFLRFVEGERPPGFLALRTYGWAAIELCVRDTLAVNARLERSPFRIIGPPRELDGLPTIFPMQVVGPDGDVVFLTQIRGDLPEYDLPRARTLVDRLFIVVLACSNIAESMRWFSTTLGVELGRRIEIAYSVLSAAFSLPESQRHTIATGVQGRDCFLEFDQYPTQAAARPGRGHDLKPGIALATLAHARFGSIPTAEWIAPPQPGPGLAYDGRRAATLRAPDGTLVELIEAG